MRTRCLVVFVSLSLLLWPPIRADEEDIQFPTEDFKRLDSFEGLSLTKADKAMAQKDYKQAAAEYDAFLESNPKSKAYAYAMVRKGRCLQLWNKRNKALEVYKDILDFFPGTPYAAAALYYTGQCHWDNGEQEKGIREWAKMAKEAEYSKHFLAAGALRKVADQYMKDNKGDQAAGIYRQVAANFRTSNQEQARSALQQAIVYYIRKPDEPSLRSLYADAKTFEHHPQAIQGEVGENQLYWRRVIENVKEYGKFEANQAEQRDRFYQYWAKAMEGKFAKWDGFQIELAGFYLAYEKDPAKWIGRLDAQFNAHQKPEDYDRIVTWVAAYAEHDKKTEEYFAKLDFAKMKNGAIADLMYKLFESPKRQNMARSVFGKLRLAEMSDEEKHHMARQLWHRDTSLVKDVCMTMKDKLRGMNLLLHCYYDHRDGKNGVPLANDLAKEADYAKDALYKKGEFLRWGRDFDKAVKAYRDSDSPPQSAYRIADCYVELGKIEQAVGELREVENFFKDHAAEAVWRIANIYKEKGKKKEQVAALREIMRKYKTSRQSSSAHQELQAMGLKTEGGVNAED